MKSQFKTRLSYLAKKISYLFVAATIVFLLLEICYRFQVIDFYEEGLQSLNKTEIKNSRPTTLVFGDSFTAHFKGYLKTVRAEFPEQNFVNAAISGTGIRQHLLLAKNRIRKHKPEHIIYQFYIGNDFTDINHPINFTTNSIARNVYWAVSDQLLVVPYLNSRLAVFKTGNTDSTSLKSDAFNESNYNQRVKTYFKADPSHLEKTVRLTGNQKQVYRKWASYFQQFLQEVPEGVSVTFLLIPHCAQVSSIYQKNMELIGAKFQNPIQTVEFPLVEQIRKDFPQLRIINPLLDFQKAEKNGQQLFFSNDPHLTEVGQVVLGNHLTKQLK